MAAVDKTKAREQALALAFEGRWSQAEIAKKCDVSPRTIWGWMKHPDFQAKLEAMRADFAASMRDVTYADKARRVVALDKMAESARREYEAHPLLEEARPTRDGLIVNEHFNADAFAAFRGALDDIAKEKGERKQVAEVTHSGSIDVDVLVQLRTVIAQLYPDDPDAPLRIADAWAARENAS